MSGGGDNGVLLGMTAANQARRAGGSKGGSSMFNVIPLLIIPVIVYSVLVIFTGGEPSAAAALMDNTVFQVPLVSGPWGMKVGDLATVIVPYPTLGEVSKRAAGSFFTPKLFSEKTRAIVRFLLKLG